MKSKLEAGSKKAKAKVSYDDYLEASSSNRKPNV